jgi:MoaA/NifB/PqqE/SkfB family radical SAM enzyme
MTPEQGITLKRPVVNWPRFDVFMEYAQAGNAETVMLTGKGEPLLFPDDVTDYLQRIRVNEERLGFQFGAKEIQTNGVLIMQKPEKFEPLLDTWADLGLTTMSISIVHYDPEKNRQEYLPYKDEYIDLPLLIKKVHDAGVRVRLACILLDGNIDSREELKQLMQFARGNDVEELTVRPVNKPSETRNEEVALFISEHQLRKEQYDDMAGYLAETGTEVRRLGHGAIVYDVNGQNVCITNSLTTDTGNYHRQLISYPEGAITTDWSVKARELP